MNGFADRQMALAGTRAAALWSRNVTIREESVRWIAAVGVAGVAASLLVPPTAFAADQGFCRDYARAAVNQVRAARSSPNCAPGARGPRWAMDWQVHFNWCLGASYKAVGAERDARTEYLRSCR